MPTITLHLDEALQEREHQERRRSRNALILGSLIAMAGLAIAASRPERIVRVEVPVTVTKYVTVPPPETVADNETVPDNETAPAAGTEGTEQIAERGNEDGGGPDRKADRGGPARAGAGSSDAGRGGPSAGGPSSESPALTMLLLTRGIAAFSLPGVNEAVQPDTRHLCLSPKFLVLGAEEQQITVSNPGGGPIAVTAVATDLGGITIDAADCTGRTLQRGETCTIGVRARERGRRMVGLNVFHDVDGHAETMRIAVR